MKKLLNILSLLFVTLLAHAQLNCTFTHYSQENGLSENSVMDTNVRGVFDFDRKTG